MKKRILFISITIATLLVFLNNCETPEGLEDVSGVEGTITFNGNWPNGITATAPVVFDESFGTLIALGDPVLKDTTDFSEHSYFIQLFPGDYCLITLGLSGIDPAYFAANLETYMEDANNGGILPLEFLENPLDTLDSNWETFTVEDKEITPFEKEVYFSGIQGNLIFEGEWPDSITAATSVIVDDCGATELDNNLSEHIVGYNNLSLNGSDTCYYFIQLNEGTYYQISVGLINIEPELFIANLDSFLTAENPPITDLEMQYYMVTLCNHPIIVVADSVVWKDKTVNLD